MRAAEGRDSGRSPHRSEGWQGVIRAGYNSEVDELREAATNGKGMMAAVEARERAATGIKNLRVGYNRVFGYYIEVTKAYQHFGAVWLYKKANAC